MYSKINTYLKNWIESTVTAEQIQTGYIASANFIDLRKSAILIEPRVDRKAAKNIRWKDSSYQIKLWIMVMISTDYDAAIEEAERILGGAEDGSTVGLLAAMDMLKVDETFRSMSGLFSGKQWRILTGRPLDYSDVSFGVSQTTSSQVATATLDIIINFEQEK